MSPPIHFHSCRTANPDISIRSHRGLRAVVISNCGSVDERGAIPPDAGQIFGVRAVRHEWKWIGGDIPSVSAEGEAGTRSRCTGCRERGLHRGHEGNANVSLAHRCISEKDGDLLTNQLTWLLASLRRCKTHRGSAGESCLGLVECVERLWRLIQSRSEHADLQVLRRFRGEVRRSVHYLDEGWYKLGNVLDVVPK